MIVAEDQEQVDKTLRVLDQTPTCGGSCTSSHAGSGTATPRAVMSWEEFLDLGRAPREEHPEALDEVLASQQPDDLATLIYTSGTTGPPKGAMLSVADVAVAIRVLALEGAFTDPPPRARRPAAVLPAALARRRAHLQHVVQRRLRHPGQLRRVDRDGAREPPRDPAHRSLRRPPDLGDLLAGIEIRLSGAKLVQAQNAAFWLRAADRIGEQLVQNSS